MSLCGDKISNISTEEVLKIFEENKVSFEQFKEKQHEILTDPRLILRIENDLYDWNTGILKLMSLLVFKQPFEETKEANEDEIVISGLDENQEAPINAVLESP